MTYQLWVRWAPRTESLSVCASRFACMLNGFAAAHPTLGLWYRQANTRAAAFKPYCAMPPTTAELEAILYRGRTIRSGSRQLDPEAGCWASAWNGRNEPEALSFTLHVNDSYPRPPYPNSIHFEGLLAENHEFVNATVLQRVMLVIAECWDADWGAVGTWDYKGRSTDARGQLLFPYGGWLTFLSPALAEKVMPPAGIVAERLPNGALFMLATEEQFDVTNPVHIANLDAIQKALAPVQRSVPSAGA